METIPKDEVCRMICKYCIKANKLCQHRWDCPLLTEIAKYKDEPQKLNCRNKEYYSSCEYANKCHPIVCFKALDELKERLKDEPQTDCAGKKGE